MFFSSVFILTFALFLQLLIDNYCDFDISRTMPGACDEQHRCLLYNGPLRLYEKQGRVRESFRKPNFSAYSV